MIVGRAEGEDEEEDIFLANDQLTVGFFERSPSSRLEFNKTTHPGSTFYTRVLWSHFTEDDRQWPVPADFNYTKTSVNNTRTTVAFIFSFIIVFEKENIYKKTIILNGYMIREK